MVNKDEKEGVIKLSETNFYNRGTSLQEVCNQNQELVSLVLWAARRLKGTWKEYVYDELERITGNEQERL